MTRISPRDQIEAEARRIAVNTVKIQMKIAILLASCGFIFFNVFSKILKTQ